MYQPPESASNAPARQRRFTLIFSLPALLVVCALLAGTAQAPVAKAVATATSQDLSPTERQRRVSKLVSNVIERSHYRQSPINDPVSSLVLDRFLEQLDGMARRFEEKRAAKLAQLYRGRTAPKGTANYEAVAKHCDKLAQYYENAAKEAESVAAELGKSSG